MTTNSKQTSPPIHTARPEAERVDLLISHLRQAYAIDPADIKVVKAPLRICPLGAHIDHQLGVVTGMTIDQSILMAFAPTNDDRVHIESLNFGPSVSFNLDHVPSYKPRDWGNYIRGAALALRRDHQINQGLIGVVGGDMPVGGLSSSAAVTIAYLLALETINHLPLTPEQNVSLVRFAENQYIGLNNGILDQTVILFSERHCLTKIDCQTIEIDKIPVAQQIDNFEILVVYSGVTDVLVGTDYNNRVVECQEAASQLLDFDGHSRPRDPRLRLVDPNIFYSEGHRLPVVLNKRASHYFGEMQRVTEGVIAWQTGDLSGFGQLMTESGESSIKYYECGSPQLITLYEILCQISGVYGVRFSGAGFRGNCIALIDPLAREAIVEAIHRHYPKAHPAEAEVYSIHFCRPDGSAQLIPWRN